MIPKLSAPLAKFIRTLEGLLVLGANVALVAVPIVTTSLTASQAVKYGVILDSVTVAARSLLKAAAALRLPAPVPLAPLLSSTGFANSTGFATSTPQVTLAPAPSAPQVDAEGWPA